MASLRRCEVTNSQNSGRGRLPDLSIAILAACCSLGLRQRFSDSQCRDHARTLPSNPTFQDLERDQDAPWDVLPFEEQAYYNPDVDFGRYYGVHAKGDIGSR